jgi:hypothetical protein
LWINPVVARETGGSVGPDALRDGRSTPGSTTMFIAIARPAVEPTGPDAVAVPGSPAIHDLTPRALHARLLENAARRRLRGMERRQADRPDDADYWLHAAPVAVRKASALRGDCGFAPLP